MKVTIEMTPEEYQQMKKENPVPPRPHWYSVGWRGNIPTYKVNKGITTAYLAKVAESYR